MPTQVEFGYYPKPLDFSVGDVSVATPPGLKDKTREVMESGLIDGDWCYAPPAQAQDFMSGKVRTLPYPSRVFSLPKTHVLTHATSSDPEHLGFLIWILGFIHGVRLSETDAGFLDATPIKPGALHDIVWLGNSEQKALRIADTFWRSQAAAPAIAKGLTGVVHSLFLSQTPTMLHFERFIYLYVALDGCHAVWCAMNGIKPTSVKHFKRIAELCSKLNRGIPAWADPTTGTVSAHLCMTGSSSTSRSASGPMAAPLPKTHCWRCGALSAGSSARSSDSTTRIT
jgi:hypothetical protein